MRRLLFCVALVLSGCGDGQKSACGPNNCPFYSHTNDCRPFHIAYQQSYKSDLRLVRMMEKVVARIEALEAREVK